MVLLHEAMDFLSDLCCNECSIAARYVLEHYCFNAPGVDAKAVLEKHMPLLRKVLFSKSLRLLPLKEQIGLVEALAVLADQLPNLIPLDDQHLLAFLSELLKMASVADGEMSDPSLVGSVVDRNGLVVSSQEQPGTEDTDYNVPLFRPSSLFLRRDCVLEIGRGNLVLAAELPPGVQLRVSSIELLRAVIRGHPDVFFDAETSTPIGKASHKSVHPSLLQWATNHQTCFWPRKHPTTCC